MSDWPTLPHPSKTPNEHHRMPTNNGVYATFEILIQPFKIKFFRNLLFSTNALIVLELRVKFNISLTSGVCKPEKSRRLIWKNFIDFYRAEDQKTLKMTKVCFIMTVES